MGDPAGIGPEIIVKALADSSVFACCRPVVLGDREVLSSAILQASQDISLNIVSSPLEVEPRAGRIDLLAVSELKSGAVAPGKPTVEGGRAMVAYIRRAVAMALKRDLDAVVTCPINKALMHRAGHLYDGHTQLISHLAHGPDYVMMLAGERLRVSLVTIHCALKDVAAMLSQDMVYRTIVLTARALEQDFGLENPGLAVAALNPHGGEEGLFGTEEKAIIRPAVERAGKEGFQVEGPFPADTLFYKAASGQFHAVVAMYHDQGLIPLKLLHFSGAVNVTLGLPIIRTSVDHGTAYDIAGKGQADASSLKAAIKMAAMMVHNRAAKKSRKGP
ncbi:MAG: 4-hydroxythreonine-4-phosphate dehydrogenase PdxA [Deltaproteobacteria bacterium]|nr:4-hydroxythreonine-4-phosphate dehydrogenase PdxA [Deltaproteobacteria bacterium]